MPLATWSGGQLPPDMRLPAPPKAPMLQAFTAGKENQRTNEQLHPNIAAAVKLFSGPNLFAQEDASPVKLQSKSCFLKASDEGAFLAAQEVVLEPVQDLAAQEEVLEPVQGLAAQEEVLEPVQDQPVEEDHALMGAAVADPRDQPIEDAVEREGFERRIESGGNDTVGTWCEYVQWISQRAPKSTEESTVLRRACDSFVGDTQHRDDIRYLRLWVRRAACEAEPYALFNFLEEHNIGSRHALRYEAAAAELERNHRFSEAEQQYALGLELCAEPLDRLQSRFKEFQDRMRKRAARKQSAQKSKVPAEASSRTMEAQPRPELQEVPRIAQAPDPRPPPKMQNPLADCSQALAEDVSWEEEQAARVFARLGQNPADASRPQLLDEEAARAESDNRTQELTTSGVLALLGDDATGTRSSRRSSAASGFFGAGEDDATYTTELAKREVLELLAHDPVHRSRQSRGGNEGNALQPLIHVGMPEARSSPFCPQFVGRNPTSTPAFEIFEESDSESRW